MKKIITIVLAGLVLCSCGVYKKYQSQNEAPDDLFGSGDSIAKAVSEASIAEISWREFFTDPLLQNLIDSALARNTDMLAAKSAVMQAQASLKAAKLAYLPSTMLAPA
jgi:outer membrane protein TolC